MTRSITITDWIQQRDTLPLVDVRTPAEFAHGHIPHARNVPLFSNEERVLVGTTYKQQSREDAILLGFDLTGTKWSGFIRQCLEIAPAKRIAVHCWRGGMRSGAMAWALGLYGFEVYQVQGGYKQFRRWAHHLFQQPYNLHVLGGMTGSGKTKLLQHMLHNGQQAIDLEGLAQHQGSAYGTMNKLVQPTQEQFENNLAWQLKNIDINLTLWLEDESRKIGKCIIPLPLWDRMRTSVMVDLQVTAEQRITTLLQDYGNLDKDFLAERTGQIKKRLGPEQTKNAITAIYDGRMADFIRIVLVYYDKTYTKGLSYRDPQHVFPLHVTGHNHIADSTTLLDFVNDLNLRSYKKDPG